MFIAVVLIASSQLTALLANSVWAQVHDDYDLQWAHSLYPPYIDASGDNQNWSYNAFISTSDHHVRLTADRPSQRGHIASKTRLQGSNWFVEFQFRIKAKARRNLGDGMAFWFTADPFQAGSAFGRKAQFQGLGLFFDTYPNMKHHDKKFPYVGVMLNDGRATFNHDTDGDGQLLAGCHQPDIVNSDGPVKCKVIYAHGTLQVQFYDPKTSAYTQCVSVDNVRMPRDGGFVAFSASTGASSAEHDLLSVTSATFSGPGIHREIVPKRHKRRTWLALGAAAGILYLAYAYAVKPLMQHRRHGGYGKAPMATRML